MGDPNRFNVIDKTLEFIHTKYVALPVEEKKNNTEILHEILNSIIQHCKRNKLFNELYREPYFGGSYYENLKIKKPDEYDIHIKLCLPEKTNYSIVSSTLSGYVHVLFSRVGNHQTLVNRGFGNTQTIRGPQYGMVHTLGNRGFVSEQYGKGFMLGNTSYGRTQAISPYYGMDGLNILIDEENNELDSKKVMAWMYSIVSQWLGGSKTGKYQINQVRSTSFGTMQIKFWMGGPALTFEVTNFRDIFFNFDFVPCFQFGKDQWPKGFRRYHDNPEKCKFYVIPKSPKGDDETIYLRTSFQEQDKDILYSKAKLKPVFRLIKQLRDKLKYDKIIVSFFIKNVFLWEADRQREEFWNLPLGYIFIEMLERLQKGIENRKILYFWNDRFNLIEHIENHTLDEVSRTLRKVINIIKANLEDPLIIAQCLRYMAITFLANAIASLLMLVYYRIAKKKLVQEIILSECNTSNITLHPTIVLILNVNPRTIQ